MSLSDELFIQVRPLGGFPNVGAALLIRRQIFQHLDLIDLVHVSQTCVRWRNIAHDNILWHASDFDSLANADADVSSGAPCMRRPSSLSAARPTIGGTCTYSDTYTAIRYSLFFSLVPFFFLRKDRERESKDSQLGSGCGYRRTRTCCNGDSATFPPTPVSLRDPSSSLHWATTYICSCCVFFCRNSSDRIRSN
jgi:hypothetical protein